MRKILKSLKEAVETGDKAKLKDLIESLSEILDFYDFSLKSISSSAKMSDFFVQHMLDFAVINQKQKNFTKDLKPFDINEAIQEVVGILKEKAQAKELAVKVHLDPDSKLYVMSDKMRMQQVFLNLLSNAHKFTPAKGRIDVFVNYEEP